MKYTESDVRAKIKFKLNRKPEQIAAITSNGIKGNFKLDCCAENIYSSHNYMKCIQSKLMCNWLTKLFKLPYLEVHELVTCHDFEELVRLICQKLEKENKLIKIIRREAELERRLELEL